MRKKSYHYYRRLSTHGELVANDEIREDGVRIKWGRARRNKGLLDSWCNEKVPINQKTWKVLRKTQYRNGKRGQRHVYEIYDKWYSGWKFEEYCREHDIPCAVKNYAHLESSWEYQKTWEIICYRPTIGCTINNIKYPNLHPIYGYVYHYDLPLVKRVWSVYDKTELIWWSDKDIGIERILNRARY